MRRFESFHPNFRSHAIEGKELSQMTEDRPFLLFAGTSNEELASEVARSLGVSLGKRSISTFPDGEIGIEIEENVRGKDAFVLQTIARRPNHYLMELLILIDALKRASCHSITFVCPYFGYARQDRKDKGRVPITAKLVADLLQQAGADRGLTMDLHAEQIQGFFDIPVDHLHARPLFIRAVKKWGLDSFVVVAPDLGSIKMAKAFAQEVGAEFAIIDKRRVDAEHVEPQALIGSVAGKAVVIVDDMVSTGETLMIGARVCKNAGSGPVYAIATHGLMADEVFRGSAIEKLIITDSIRQSEGCLKDPLIEVVSCASLFSQAIEYVLSGHSISSLFHK
jgi:ribose-phosphate pyrophosphokinase